MLVLWAGLLLSACSTPLEFTVPLADPGTERIDPRLLGTWYGVSHCTSSGNPHICSHTGGLPVMLTTLALGSAPDGNTLAVHATILALDVGDLAKHVQDLVAGRVLQLQATAHPATLDGVTYYNIRRTAGAGYDYTGRGESPHYMLAQVELEGEDTLYLRVMIDLPMSAQPIEGSQITRQGFGYDIVDATREQIIAMIRGADRSKLFAYRLGPFSRLKRFDANAPDTALCVPDNVRRVARFGVLSETALSLAKFGLTRQARATAKAALQQHSLGVAEEFGGSVGLGEVAEALAIVGDLEDARDVLDRELKNSAPTLSAIRALARLGPVSDALKITQQLGFERSEALENIALIQLETGDMDGALATALMIGVELPPHMIRGFNDERAMHRVADVFHRSGHTTDALKLLQKAVDLPVHSMEGLLETARRQLEWGGTDAARRTVVELERWAPHSYSDNPEFNAYLRIKTAEMAVTLGQKDAARALIEPVLQRISAAELQSWPVYLADAPDATSRLLVLQQRLGDEKGAQQTMDRLIGFIAQHRSELSEYEGSARATQAYVVMGNLSKAMETASNKADRLYEIAATQRYLGDLKGAAQTLKLALARAQQESIGRPPSAVAVLPLRRAEMHHEAGDADGTAFYLALLTETAMLTHPESAKVAELLHVAESQKELGDIGGARATALHAMTLAEAMPVLEECGSELLELLTLPELEGQVDSKITQ